MEFIDNQTILLDKEGFLQHLSDWNPSVATRLATNEHIYLEDTHWEIIWLLRDFYQQFELSPAMRPLVKFVGQQLGINKGNSIYLLTLFPGSPAKIAAKIAGLPRPENCL